MNLKIKLSIALVMSLMLVACGGGGSGGVKTMKVYRMIEITEGSQKEEVNHYNENGVLEKKEYFSSDGTLDVFYLYSYDENGLLQVQDQYVGGEKFRGTIYDPYGNNITYVFYSGSGGADINIINTYDDLGRLKTREEDPAGGANIGTFTYNSNTVTETYTSKSTGDVIGVIKKTYNEQGDLTKKSVSGSALSNSNSSYKFTYEYDENKNLVKKIVGSLQNDGSYRTQYVYEYTWKAFTIPESYLCKRKPESIEAKGCALYSSEVLAEK